jgi:hypothetical protein
MNLSDRAEGRVIHMIIDVTLTPPNTEPCGETDAAMAIGRGLINEAALLIKNAAEAEGFSVEFRVNQVVY